MVGDFDVESTWSQIERPTASIPAGPSIPEVEAREPEQRGERRSQIHYPAQSPSVSIAYKAVPVTDPDGARA